MFWYSLLFKNFPQFVVSNIVQDFSIVNEAEEDFFFLILLLFYNPIDVGNLICCSSAFSKSSLYTWEFFAHVLLNPA